MRYRFNQMFKLLMYVTFSYFIIFEAPVELDSLVIKLFKIDIQHIILFKFLLLTSTAILFVFTKKLLKKLYYTDYYRIHSFFTNFVYKHHIQYNTFIVLIAYILFVVMLTIIYPIIYNNIVNYPYYIIILIFLGLVLILLFVYIICSIIIVNKKLKTVSEKLFIPLLELAKANIGYSLSDYTDIQRRRLYELINNNKTFLAFDNELFEEVDRFLKYYGLDYIHPPSGGHTDYHLSNDFFNTVIYNFNFKNYYITKESYFPLNSGEG